MEARTSRANIAAQQYLTFDLAEEIYGLPILKVNEIIGLLGVTRVPNTPEFIKGVINLRGTIIPVVDLRRKFGMAEAEPTAETCIIVLDSGDTRMGIIVDRVREVQRIADENVTPPPPLGANVSTDFLKGIGTTATEVLLLLDIDVVLSERDTIDIKSALSLIPPPEPDAHASQG